MAAPAGPDGQGGPHVFVADLGAPALSEADHHHLAAVLRMRDGDPLTLGDGDGRWCAARFASTPEVSSEIIEVPAPSPVGVGFALVKGSKPELVVQKLTELGIDFIAIFAAERSIVRWDDAKRKKNQRRLETVAREAAMQSRRVRIPTIELGADFSELAARSDVGIADIGVESTKWDDSVSWVLIGPEGGWTDTERSQCSRRVSLGSTVLRAETAAIAAGVRLTLGR